MPHALRGRFGVIAEKLFAGTLRDDVMITNKVPAVIRFVERLDLTAGKLARADA
jgi:hypothetical protein